MSSDKILHRIQQHIDELAPILELFTDAHVQPSVQDCEQLQKHLSSLQENLAVYKYNKQNKELSPSFNIHARVSEKEFQEEKKAEIAREIKETVNLEKNELKDRASEVTETKKNQTEPTGSFPPITIGINDKFRFINELFSQNSSEYNIAIEQINNVKNWNEGEIYLNGLKSIYEWDEREEVVKHFFSIVKKRFD